MRTISELEKKLEGLDMEIHAIFLRENEDSKSMLTDLKQWRQRSDRFLQEFKDALLSVFSSSNDALSCLQRDVKRDMDTTYVTLLKTLTTPDGAAAGEDEDEDVVDPINRSHVKKRAFGETISTTKALMSQIKLEISQSKKTTLVEYLQVEDYRAHFGLEWTRVYELWLSTIRTAKLVSKLMVQFIFCLASNEELLRLLKSRIESIKNMPMTKCRVAERFVNLIEMAENALIEMKLKESMFSKISAGKEASYDTAITHFYQAVMDLEWIMSFDVLPEKRGLVNDARIRIQGVLGSVLYNMQGVETMIKNINPRYWKKMRDVIPTLWKGLENLPENRHVQEQGIREARTTGTKPDNESHPRPKKESQATLRMPSEFCEIREEDEDEHGFCIIRKEDEDEHGFCIIRKEDEGIGAPLDMKGVGEAAVTYGNKKEDQETAGSDKLKKLAKKDDEGAGNSSGMKDVQEAGESSGM